MKFPKLRERRFFPYKALSVGSPAEENRLDDFNKRLGVLWGFREGARGDFWNRKLVESSCSAAFFLLPSSTPHQREKLEQLISFIHERHPQIFSSISNTLSEYTAQISVKRKPWASVRAFFSRKYRARLERAEKTLLARRGRLLGSRLQAKRNKLMGFLEKYAERERVFKRTSQE
ncbi:hypothetical protein HY991_05575 [Candidatus Micrarchaeota archaeon]|nr:hypothetical protein [Candidatus Micrarchaeota archaeon]